MCDDGVAIHLRLTSWNVSKDNCVFIARVVCMGFVVLAQNYSPDSTGARFRRNISVALPASSRSTCETRSSMVCHQHANVERSRHGLFVSMKRAM